MLAVAIAGARLRIGRRSPSGRHRRDASSRPTDNAGTTIASIAEAADVSVETIYKRFGGKPGLVRAISEKGQEGAGPIPAEQRSDAMRTLERDPHAVMQRWGAFTTEVAPLAAPIALLLR